ncbi:MAG: rRNA pseudouridine synthase, partial [Clostridia bacterium]|nr:rRNA pseudouridine synthase [Clostridia bacterium]
MRLDKLLSVTATATRSEAAKAARAGAILVNGKPVKKADVQVDPDRDAVVYCGTPVCYKQYRYVLLNKPDGYVSATEDGRDPTVLELLPPLYTALELFPCGRLDKHTLGLMLLTNDG